MQRRKKTASVRRKHLSEMNGMNRYCWRCWYVFFVIDQIIFNLDTRSFSPSCLLLMTYHKSSEHAPSFRHNHFFFVFREKNVFPLLVPIWQEKTKNFFHWCAYWKKPTKILRKKNTGHTHGSLWVDNNIYDLRFIRFVRTHKKIIENK